VVVLGKMNRWLSSSLGEIRLIWDGVDETWIIRWFGERLLGSLMQKARAGYNMRHSFKTWLQRGLSTVACQVNDMIWNGIHIWDGLSHWNWSLILPWESEGLTECQAMLNHDTCTVLGSHAERCKRWCLCRLIEIGWWGKGLMRDGC
jgi:hypothetical protein